MLRYVYWVVPRRKKRELEQQQRATTSEEPHDSAGGQQLTAQSSDELFAKPVAHYPDKTDMHMTPDAAKSKDLEQISDPVAKIPAAHHLRALSAG